MGFRSVSSGVSGTIDIGSSATNRNISSAALYTYIDLANSANLDGEITSVGVWANTAMTGFRVGTFYLVSGTTYRCRDSATIGAVTAGSEQTFAGLNIDVKKGDFIGCYYATGKIEWSSSGGSGVRATGSAGEFIDKNDETSYGIFTGEAMSLYGTGVELVGRSLGAEFKFYPYTYPLVYPTAQARELSNPS